MKQQSKPCPLPDYPCPIETLETFAADRQIPADFLRKAGWSNHPAGGIVLSYRNLAGSEAYCKERGGTPNCQRVKQRFYVPAGTKQTPYGLPSAVKARSSGGRLLLTEGESDCVCLWYSGFFAVGLPGFQSSNCLEPEHLEGITELVVFPDADNSGAELIPKLVDRVNRIGWNGKIKAAELPPGVKDLCELHLRTPGEDFKAAVNGMVKHAQEVPRGNKINAILKAQTEPENRTKPPAELPAFRPFPIRVFPEPIRGFVQTISKQLSVDPSMVALPVLAGLAGAIGTSRRVHPWGTWQEFPAVWAAVVARTGSLKTPAMRAALAPLQDIQTARWKARKQVEKEAFNDDMIRPELADFMSQDATIEAVQILIERNAERGVVVAVDELDSWLSSLTKYRGGKGSDRPHWLTLWSGEPLAVARVNREGPRLSKALCSIVGTIQPGTLAEAFDQSAITSGLTGRFLLCWPPPSKKRRPADELDRSAVAAYKALVDALVSMKEEPTPLNLSDPALSHFETWYNHAADRLDETDDDGIRAALAKLDGYCLRFALIFHLVDLHRERRPDRREPVSLDAIKSATALADWFAYESERVFRLLQTSSADREHHQIVEWIRSRSGAVSVRDLQRRSPAKYRTSEDAEKRLAALVDAGLARWRTVGPTEAGGRPTAWCELLPDEFETDTI